MFYSFDGKSPVVGILSYVSETAIVVGDVTIGERCYIGHGAILRGDYGAIRIGDETAVEEGCIVHAPPGGVCVIGKRVTMGHGAIIHAKSVGDNCLVGMGAILSIRSETGDSVIVAEGAVVRQGQIVPPSLVVAGNPAKRVRDITDGDREHRNWAKQVYIDLAAKYCREGMQRLD